MISLRILLMAITLSIGAYANNAAAQEWKRYTIDLSGKLISISAPQGNFREQYRASVDLSTNQKDLLVLFENAWIFSGAVGDSGALEVKLLLKRLPNRGPNLEFIDAVRADYRRTLSVDFPNVELLNFENRSLGGRVWTCFTVSPLAINQCVLEVDQFNYIAWRTKRINNGGSGEIPGRKELTDQIERSINVAF